MAGFFDKVAAAGLKPPRRVFVMMTHGCNLACSHCWPDSGPLKSIRPVPASVVQRMIGELSRLNVEAVCLTGGEPFTHPDWSLVLSDACRPNRFKQIGLQTNGTLLDDARIKILKSFACDHLQIQVSLDGVGSISHDRVRGAGSFESALGGLKRLSAAGLGKQTQVLFTEMRHNVSELPSLLELVDGLGLSGCVSGTLVCQGRAREADGIAFPLPSQYEDLLNRYQQDALFRSRYDRLGNFAALEWFKGRAYPSAQGCICIETPYIDAQGLIYPCCYMPAPQYAVAGAHQRPLEAVLTEALPLWAELPEIGRRRRRELQACRHCTGWLHCAAGCMGRAYAAFGDFMAVEDRCLLRKAVYSWKGRA